MPHASSVQVWAFFTLMVLLATAFAPRNGPLAANAPQTNIQNLTGLLLVARPEMPDPRFRDTVIFIARHDENGAFGLIVNRPLGEIDYATIIENLGVDAAGLEGEIAIFFGGPVDPKRGFILHSNDYPHPPLIPVNDRYSISMSTSLLLALANGFGPKHSILAIGYAGWSKDQLEQELARKDWVVAPSNDEIMFDSQFASKWKRAYDSRYLNI